MQSNPDAFVVVVGCYAQLKPKEIAQIEGVDLVLGAGEKFNLISHLEGLQKSDEPRFIAGEIKEVRDFVPGFSSGDRTRTFLKVQDGCNYFCAFCTIPLARGRSRSANVAQTVAEAQKAVAAGAKEIVLLLTAGAAVCSDKLRAEGGQVEGLCHLTLGIPVGQQGNTLDVSG